MPRITRIAEYRIDLAKPLEKAASWLMMEGDRKADALRLVIVRGGEAVDLSGAVATGYVDRADGQSILCAGTVSGNVVTVPLLDHCYSVPGSAVIRVTLTVASEAITRTVLAVNGYVEPTGSGVVLDPSGSLPTLEDIAGALVEISAALDTARTATETANQAAGRADAAAQSAAQDVADALEAANGEINAALEAANEEISTALEAANSEISTTLENATGEIGTAMQAANNALSAANGAVAAANQAEANANAAVLAANEAASAANQAADAANQAAAGVGTVLYSAPQTLTDEQKAVARGNIGAMEAADMPDVTDVLRYSAQTLTAAQKTQARANIGAMETTTLPNVSDVLRYSAQSLSDAQKAQARTNVGAISHGAILTETAATMKSKTAAQVTALYNDGYRVAVTKNGETTVALALGSNGSLPWLGSDKPLTNLLDNADLRNPVNQRCGTSYTGTVYGVDRWRGMNASSVITVESGDVKVQRSSSGTQWAGIVQKIPGIEKFAGKNVTLCFCAQLGTNNGARFGFVNLSGSNVADVSVTSESPSGSSGTWIYTRTATVPTNATVDTFAAYIGLKNNNATESLKLLWAALYEGDYVSTTCPPFTPRGYAAELTQCMRYYQQSADSSSMLRDGFYSTVAGTASSGSAVPFPVKMASDSPTITLYSPFTGTANAIRKLGGTEDITSVTTARITASGFTVQKSGALTIGSVYTYHYTASCEP